MNKITQITICLIIILISGCIANEQKEVYYSTVHNDTITLFPDYTFTEVNQKNSGSGTYKVVGENVTMIYTPFGNVMSYYRNSTGLYASDGDTWSRI